MKSQICTLIFVLLLSIGCTTNQGEKTVASSPVSKSSAGKSQLLTAAELSVILQNQSQQQLVDVRTPEEFAAGHIAGAQNINIYDDDFKTRIASLDQDKPVYLYCKAGKRSAKAAGVLKGLGFTEIFDLKGGYDAWPAEKNPE